MKRHATSHGGNDMKNPFRQTGMRKMYAACLELAADSNSEFYVKGAEKWMRRTGAMHRTSFWAGVEAFESGGPRPFSARSYTLSRAAFQAGKDFAEKQLKEERGRVKDIKSFVSECLDYYGEGGTYDIRANSEEIKKALEIRLNDKKGVLREFSKPLSEIEFDGGSVDREMIRDIVLTLRGEKPWETIFSSMPYGERSSENE